jgi:hypothetical protein
LAGQDTTVAYSTAEPEVAKRVVALTLAGPPPAASHWTGSAMAKAAGISVSSLQRTKARKRRKVLFSRFTCGFSLGPTHHFRADHRRTPQNSCQSGLMGIYRGAARSSRDRATSCWRRIASVRTNNPPMESASLSSTKARARNCSTTAGVSLLKLPPPNSLISARCSSLDNASQPAASDIVGAP